MERDNKGCFLMTEEELRKIIYTSYDVLSEREKKREKESYIDGIYLPPLRLRGSFVVKSLWKELRWETFIEEILDHKEEIHIIEGDK